MKRTFASDNNASIHPAILDSIISVNENHALAYGADIYTEKAINKFKAIFGEEIEVFFVFNGTAANVLSLQALTNSYNSIICSSVAHIYVDECGAPEKFTGCKLVPVETEDGKLTVEKIEPYLYGFGVEHHVQPKVISITQSTEYGTLYTFEEIKELSALAHKNNMWLHMDGARIANAAVALKTDLKTLTNGVDVLSFGGTKNGLMFGEAIIFFNKALANNFKYLRKQGMQLASKMRFISAQFEALLSNDLWLKNASQANNMAQLLYNGIKDLPRIKITQKTEVNSIFAILPPEIISVLQEKYYFYVWNERTSEVRLMCSFDTQEEEIKSFIELLKSVLK